MAPRAAAELAIAALERARTLRARALLIDFSGLSLTEQLSTLQSYDVGVRLAQQGAGLGRVAFCMSADCIAANRFALEVATNRGLAVAAFTNERAALIWLRCR